MLSALKNLKSKAETKAKELVSTITHGKGISKSIDKAKGDKFIPSEFGYIEGNIPYTRREATAYREGVDSNELYRYSYYIFNDQEWKEHQKEISNIYNNDKEALKNYRKDMFGQEVTSHDANYSPVIIAGEVPMKIVQELYSMKSDKIKFAALEENYDLDDLPFPVARLAVAGKDPICLADFLETSKCKEYGIDAITICNTDENKTRGVRLTLCQDEDGQEVRSYEILNGTYDIDLNWEVEGKKCEMKISVNADGSAKILKRNGVTDEEIYAHTEVMVGKQHDTKSLYEALGLQQTQGKSMEKVKPTLHKRSRPAESKEDAKIKELMEKNPEVQSALKEFASEVKEESSESFKPLTNVEKANVKEAGPSIGR